jgi:hypothetical protein
VFRFVYDKYSHSFSIIRLLQYRRRYLSLLSIHSSSQAAPLFIAVHPICEWEMLIPGS